MISPRVSASRTVLLASAALAGVGLSAAAPPAAAAVADQLVPVTQSPFSVKVEPVAQGLPAPVYLTDANDGTDRQFVVDQTGDVRVIKNGQLQSTPFLSVKNELVPVNPGYDERGLLGLAFDPDFKTTGKLYTYYSTPVNGTADYTVPLAAGVQPNHQNVVVEWKVDPNNPDRVDPNSRREVLRIDHPQFNHNGAQLAFGPDKLLYLSIGDGGGADDQDGQKLPDDPALGGPGRSSGHGPTGNGQNPATLQGKILRIDPNGTNGKNGKYGVPADNPFVGQSGKAPEIYALGFRNPYRFSFDKATGKLIVGDVGQISVEEVDVVTKGGNYGWRVKEGSFLFDPRSGDQEGVATTNSPGSPAGLIDPTLQYKHGGSNGGEGEAVVGGYVYNGSLIPQLQGKYIFGDLSRSEEEPLGRLFVGDLDAGTIQALNVTGPNGFNYFVKGFGEDAQGELYVLASESIGLEGGGVVLKVTGAGPNAVPLPAPLALGAVGLLVAGWAARRWRRKAGGA